ncbi:putative Copper acquisition factor BIM1-like domain-containing protein [Seiridium cardinale]
MVPVFNIDGPTNTVYQDNICLSRVPLPAGVEVKPGDNVTIQIVEAAKHGAALYSCVDITFVGADEAPSLDSISCTNSSSISFSAVSTGNTLRWGWYTASPMIGLGLGVGLPLLITVSALSYFLWKARKQLKAH